MVGINLAVLTGICFVAHLQRILTAVFYSEFFPGKGFSYFRFRNVSSQVVCIE